MNLLLLADRVPASPWHAARLPVDVALGLAARGHAVMLGCDSIEEDRLPGVAVFSRRGFDHRGGPSPRAFAAWARRLARDHARDHDAVLSFSRLFAADVWLPLGPVALDPLRRLGWAFGPRGPLNADAVVATVKRSPRAAWRAVAEARAAATAGTWVRELLVFGPRAAEEAVRRGLGARPAGEPRAADEPAHDAVARPRVTALGLPGPTARPEAAALAALRARTRTLLRIAPERVAVLVTLTGGVDMHLLPLLRAAAYVQRSRPQQAPLLVLATSDLHAAHAAAGAAGLSADVRVVPPTTRFDALLAAADVAAVCAPAATGDLDAGSPARFVADAMAFSRPVLVLRGAPGAAFVARHHPSAGALVAAPRAADWFGALQNALDPTWRIGAGIAARSAADLFGLGAAPVLDAVEAALGRAALRRRPGPPAFQRGPGGGFAAAAAPSPAAARAAGVVPVDGPR